ncbi:rhodanese-like domain-containing protein [Gammaproteobacteria bacterium]|nr:rhodanese-like domain-containing protein [Gammaproteobacteria bacterium]
MNEIDIQKLFQEANDAVPRLSFEEASNIILEKNTLIIDVREINEIKATGLINNAVNIPKSIIDTYFNRSLIDNHINDKEKTFILVYCAAGIRSALVGHKLQKEGYKKVFNLGGYAEWIEKQK